jgi:hypothetical protein
VTAAAPPAAPGASGRARRVAGLATAGGALSFLALAIVGQLMTWILHVAVGTLGFVTWVEVGVLVALSSLRAELHGTGPAIASAADQASGLRFVPFLFTIGFLWLTVRVGRRAVRDSAGPRPLTAIGLAAVGAAVGAATPAAVLSSLVSVSGLAVTITVDPVSAALWAGALAAAGAATGALFELRPDATPARVLRGAIAGVGSALALLVLVVLVVATFEPAVTRSYVDGLRRLGGGGAALFGAHVVALPAQSALLLGPAAGSCIDVLAADPALRLCPWTLTPTGAFGAGVLGGRVPLSPWFWLANVVPLSVSAIAGRVGARRLAGRRALGIGVAAGLACGIFVVTAAWFVAPRWFVPSPVPLPLVVVRPRVLSMTAVWLAWGLVGGAIGGWLAARRYEAPGSPSPTSA